MKEEKKMEKDGESVLERASPSTIRTYVLLCVHSRRAPNERAIHVRRAARRKDREPENKMHVHRKSTKYATLNERDREKSVPPDNRSRAFPVKL